MASAVLAFIFMILAGSNASVVTYEMFNTCFYSKDPHKFLSSNTTASLSLALTQHGLNCSLEFLSHSPKLEFQFVSLNLPRDSQTGKCLDSVKIWDFNKYETIELCELSDLPENMTFTTTSPGTVTVQNRCTPVQCNYAQSGFKFELLVTENFEVDAVKVVTPEPIVIVENSTCVIYQIVNDNSTDSKSVDAQQGIYSELTVIILTVFVVVIFIVTIIVCWFGRKALCYHIYHVESGVDATIQTSRLEINTTPVKPSKPIPTPATTNGFVNVNFQGDESRV